MRTAFSRVSGMAEQQLTALAGEFDKFSRVSVSEPIAVVGIGCRFPGNVTDPESFWKLLVDGRDAITEVPADRWDGDAYFDPDPMTPGRMTTKWGGFLPDVAGFDADFFGISPREAASMDPQQRVLLEVAWEALEHAGIPPDSLSGTRTGVMMGVYFTEYQDMLAARPENADAYTATGNAHSITVGRISYLLGLRGPAVAIDTACSSSLVAIHLACQSLRTRESDLALAGGVSLTLGPETQIAISAWGLLSPHGRSATFDAAADGIVRGEGAGVVVLKRLTDAVRDGDNVLAVVRGSAVNSDGRSAGVTAPNTAAQIDVIADTLKSGDVAPESVHYVEAHGTGTALGDPIEFEALAATYGRGDAPCALGAVKTNIGHTEAAAGVAGFIKATLAVQRGQIPPNLHFSQWNPTIDAAPTRFFVPTENVKWPTADGPRRASISSFGLGGTNAHVVIEQGQDVAAQGTPTGSVSTLVVSGKTPQRVAATASVLADWIEGPGAGVPLADVAHTLNHHRARHANFATVVARDTAQAVAGLRGLAESQSARVCADDVRGHGTVFVYSGRGSQWAGMGRQLLADEPAFAQAVADLEPVFVEQAGFSLLDVLSTGKELVGIEQIQLGVIGMQLALTELWRSHGVEPDMVIGHSMGEVAAAVVAGALTPAEGLRVTATRSRLMAPLSGLGGMALLELDVADTEELIAGYPQVTLGIYNSPRQTVIAGPTQQIDELINRVRARDRFASRVKIEVAPHNPAMDQLQPAMRAELADLAPRPPSIPIISTTYDMDAQISTGSVVFDAEHWATNMRNPVRFQQAISAAGADHATFIEISPHPLLTQAISETLTSDADDTGKPAHYLSIGTLQRDADDTITFHTNLNATRTTAPDTPHPPEPRPHIPGTPWEHTRHWVSEASTAPVHAGSHPLLGFGVIDPTNGTRVWENELSPELLWLGDHVIDDVCVLPGAAYAELALAAVHDAFGPDGVRSEARPSDHQTRSEARPSDHQTRSEARPSDHPAQSEARPSDHPTPSWVIRDVSLDQLMHIGHGTTLVTTLTGDENLSRIEIRTRTADSEWISHATATVELATPSADGPPPAIAGPAVANELDAEELYERLRAAGQQHGPAFRGIVGLAVSPSGEAIADVRLPATAKAGPHKFHLHPVMMDIAAQTLGATQLATGLAAGEQKAMVLPVAFRGVRVYGDVGTGVRAVSSLAETDNPDRLLGKVVLLDANGRPLLEIDEVEAAVLRSGGATTELSERLFTMEWEPAPLAKPADSAGTPRALLLVGASGADDPLLNALESELSERIEQCQVLESGDDPVSSEQALRAAISRRDTEWDGIVVVFPPRAVDESQPQQTQLDLAQERTLAVARIVKTLSSAGIRNSPRLWLVTRGGQQVDPAEPVTLPQAQLRGLTRVLTFEHSELKPTIVDIDPDGTVPLSGLRDELLAGAGHDEVALRAGQRYVRRVEPAPTTRSGELVVEDRYTTVNLDAGGAFKLEVDEAGRLDGLKVHAVRRVPPAEGLVEVRITAAALNFSDVLKAMGLYPGLDGAAPIIGGECAGVVTAVGAGVDSVAVGQRVIAFGPGTIGSHVTTVADLVVPTPDTLSDAEAAAFGGVYLTAWHSLIEVGRLAPGERVLIHSGTGGVGLAAISIAKMVGARIYTTAGSDAKREMLSGLGVDYVGDSRSVAFADEILAQTDGAGVDVILNSLAGEAIRRGIDILAPGGRFVEIGKKDVFADASIGLAALARSASFSVVDLNLNMYLQPKRYREMLEQILSHVAKGQLTPLPVTEFSFENVIDAFRLMASGRHTGKIVITVPEHGSVRALASRPAPPLVKADGGYLVVGGMGGLGLVTARWLAQQGAGMIVLNGRSAPGAQTTAAIEELAALGSRIEVVTGDIADPATAPRLVAAVEDAGFRLAGVVHSAMVLADEIVLNMSETAATRIFTSKVAGSWWLHQATTHADLDWWMAFSSAASMIGSPGQGAYAAANAWLDGLISYRRSLGLPAIGINWGPWAEVGRAQFLAELGIAMITATQGLAAMEAILSADRAHTGVFSLDARQWFQSFPAAAGSSLFSKLQDSLTIENRAGGRIRAELDACDAGERQGRLAGAIADEVRGVLGSTRSIDHNHPVESLGLDSLMALELRNRLETLLGTSLPVALVFAYPTISDLAGALCERLGYALPDEIQETPDAEESLSDEELDLLSDLVDASELEAATGSGES